MFGKVAKESRPTAGIIGGNAVNIIAPGTTLKGDIKSEGDLRIDGKVIGHVNSMAKVAIGPTGFVEGDVVAENADISGKVTGNIKAENILFLKASAIVDGDIFTGKLVVESGATFNGHCTMQNGDFNKPLKQNISSPASALKKETV